VASSEVGLDGGVKAGVVLGLLVVILSSVVGAIHVFFSLAFLSVGLTSLEIIFQMIAHAIEESTTTQVLQPISPGHVS